MSSPSGGRNVRSRRSRWLAQRDTLIDVGPNAPQPERPSERTPLRELIAQGEGETLEFKQTFRWDIRTATASKKIEDSSLKAIAAFANHLLATCWKISGHDLGVEPSRLSRIAK